MTQEEFRKDRAGKLTSMGSIRVMKWLDRGWSIFSNGLPILCGFEKESDAWVALAGLCLEKSIMAKG